MFLSREQLWDMSVGGRDTSNEMTHWGGNVLYGIVSFICKVCWRYEVKGLENLRAFKGKTGAVVIGNHTSYLDVVLMHCSARPDQWVRFMGRDTLFEHAGGFFGQILSRVGAFPVARDSADRTAIKRAARMLKNDEYVGIMPEGTRRGKGSLDPKLHSGMAFIAKMGGNVPILPMTVRNVENIKRKGERLRFPKVTVEYGTPVLLEDFDFLPKKERLDGCTWYAMRECFALSQQIPREQVDMVALFPDDVDYSEVFANHPIPLHSSAEVADAIVKRRTEEAAVAAARAQKKAETAQTTVESRD